MANPSPGRLSEIVAECQARMKSATDRMVTTFRFVPDDKLRWSPSETARSPLDLVAHCALANRFFAGVIRGEPMPPMPQPGELRAWGRQLAAEIPDARDAIRRLEASRDEVIAALGTMTPERFATEPAMPGGSFPMHFWMGVPGQHMEGHASQMDYLQTIWGDLVDHR